MATAYHRDQAGAPELVYTSSTTDPAQFAAFKTILKACLVYGFGSKPAAGWELVNEGTNFLVLRNGSHSGYVCFTRASGTNFMTVYLSSTYTGMSGDVMTGDGLKSGTSSGNTLPQRAHIGNTAFGSGVCSWAVVADAKTMVLVIGCGNSSVPYEYSTLASTSSLSLTLYVGEDSAGNFISLGGQNIVGNATNYFDRLAFTTLTDPNTGLLVGAGSIAPFIHGLWRVGPTALDSVVLAMAEVHLSPPVWGVGALEAGTLRGVTLPAALGLVLPSPAAQSIGFSGPLNSRNFNTPIDLGDGYTHIMGVSFHQSITHLITDHPGFWP